MDDARVLFNDRPGGWMYEVERVLRGISAKLRADVRLIGPKGEQATLTEISVHELASGEGRVHLISGRTVFTEFRMDSYDLAVQFLEGFAHLAEAAKSVPAS